MSTVIIQQTTEKSSAERSRSKLVPELRFKEFGGGWNQMFLGQMSSKVGSGSTPKGGVQVYQETGIPFIRSQNVYNDKLFIDETHISEKMHSQMKGSTVLPNDILLNITGGSIGRSCVVPEDFNEGNVNQHVCIIRLKPKFSTLFVQPFLSSEKGQKLIYQGQTGSGREGINFQSIRLFKLHIPTLPEQQKIAQFLGAVDEKIQQLTQKKALLEQYKKGVIQKLFRQEIRFKQEDGSDYPAWEEKRLGDFCKFFSGGTPSSDNKDYYSGEIPFIGSGNIYDSEVFNFISQDALNNSSAKLVIKGDLLYALYGANSGEVSISKMEGAINQAILCIRTKDSIEFLYYVLSLNKGKIVSKYLQGGQGNLSSQIIKKLKYDFPSLEEQQKIASFLSGIDSKIAQVAQQLESTQSFKKGLLQKMFV